MLAEHALLSQAEVCLSCHGINSCRCKPPKTTPKCSGASGLRSSMQAKPCMLIHLGFPSAGKLHVVKPGDTLPSIAQQYGVDVTTLKVVGLFKPGRTICIPAHPLKCGGIAESGGQSATDSIYGPIATQGIKGIKLSYDAQDIPDQFRIRDQVSGKNLYSTGFVRNVGNFQFQVPPNVKQLAIVVSSPEDGTAWNFKADCLT